MHVMAQAFRGEQPMHPDAVRAPLLGLCDGDVERAAFVLAEITDTGRASILTPSGFWFEIRPCR